MCKNFSVELVAPLKKSGSESESDYSRFFFLTLTLMFLNSLFQLWILNKLHYFYKDKPGSVTKRKNTGKK
jgi:hypothetical protein